MNVIIQARTGSERFENKVLYKINGRPLIWHMIRSIKKSDKIKDIYFAIPRNKNDDVLFNYIKRLKVKVYRGSENNVAKRILDLAEKKNFNSFMRLSADSPLIDYKLINKAIMLHKKYMKNFDLITNLFPRTYPSGQSVEIINTNTLKKNISLFNKDEKEHVTKFFYKKFKKFKIKNFKSNKKINIKYSIDTKNDLKKLKNKFKK